MTLSIIGMLIISGMIARFEIPILAKQKLTKEIWTFSILLLLGTIVSVMMIAGIKITSPFEWMTIFRPMGNFIRQMFGL
ncbi:hypothetical protein GN156_09215 [bacterium LRH843]|nr:hypothetical protein [bacterium LRH843]